MDRLSIRGKIKRLAAAGALALLLLWASGCQSADVADGNNLVAKDRAPTAAPSSPAENGGSAGKPADSDTSGTTAADSKEAGQPSTGAGEPSGPVALTGIRMMTATTGWGQDGGGRLYRTEDGARRWRAVKIPGICTPDPHTSCTDAFELDADHAWVLDAKAMRVFRTEDGGAHWEEGQALQPGHVWDSGIAFTFADDRNGWIELMGGGHAQTGELFRTKDGGQSWTEVSASDPKAPQSLPFGGQLIFLDADHGWTYRASEEGLDAPQQLALYRTEDGGATWSHQNLPIPDALADVGKNPMPVHASGQSILLAVSTGAAEKQAGDVLLYRSEDGGGTWKLSDTGVGGQGRFGVRAAFVDARTGWLWGGGLNKLLRTEDGGAHWKTAAEGGAAPGDAAELQFVDADNGWWTARGLNESGEETVSFQRTEDGGATWQSLSESGEIE